jgi:nicotinamidase/pyrazinamidase
MTNTLILVDVQNDFIDGSLAVAGGEQVAQRIAHYIETYELGYDHIVTTQDWHIRPNGHFSDEPDFTATWPVHCLAGTNGAELSPRLDPILGWIDARFRKGHYSAAYSGFEGFDTDGMGLADWLRERGVTDVDVVGIATDYCVKATALDAVREGFRTTVLLPYTAAVDASAGGSGERAIAEMREGGVFVPVSID